MAGDWIKMRRGLRRHPKVVRIASALKADGRPDPLRVVGALHELWSLFDEYSEDGAMVGYTVEMVDSEIGWPGFSAAVVAVHWMVVDGESLALPEFDTHNGGGAKRRALDADRKKAVRKMSASEADKMGTREEKRREDKKPPVVPQGGPKPAAQPKVRKQGIGIKAWLDSLGTEKAIPAGDSVFQYAKDAGIPGEYVKLAWVAFRKYHEDRPDKRQLDWRATFRNYVSRNYLKLWRATAGGGYELTDNGVQEQRALKAREGSE